MRTDLSAEALVGRLQAACAATLRQTPSDFFDAFLQRWGKGGASELARHPGAVKEARAELEMLLGPAHGEPSLELSSSPLAALLEASLALAGQTEKQLAELVYGALSEPQFRLARVENPRL